MRFHFSKVILIALFAILNIEFGPSPQAFGAQQPDLPSSEPVDEAPAEQISPATDNDPASTSTDGNANPIRPDDPSTGEPATGLTYSNPVQIKWKITAKIRGGSGPAHRMIVTMPVPIGWPEQSVAIVEEDIPGNISNIAYRDLDSRVKQLVASIPVVNPREEITISMTFLVSTSQINPPETPSAFSRPKSNHKAGRSYLGVGPQINYRNSKLRNLVKEVVVDKDDVWSEVEAIYDWIRDNIEDRTSEPEDVLSVFRAKAGCNEDKVGLFVAMCRAHKIPARIVWVQGTQYAEFMLVDSEANPHWFPCNVGGIREFGSVAEPRIILQKGDSIRVPEKEARQKFVGEFAVCEGKSKPSVKFYRELLPAE